MRKIMLMMVLALSFITLHAQQTVTVRVMSMNVKEGGGYIDHQSEPFSEVIRKYSPDVVALQEVDWMTSRNGRKDWLNEVAFQTGMFPYYAKSFDYQGGGFGVALLSRYPFYKAKKAVYSNDNAREDRATGWIYVQLPGGGVIRVASTHLAVESSDIRVKQFADFNMKFFAEDTSTPALLLGDFNDRPDSDLIAYVKNRWQEIARGSGNTIPSSGPTTQLDYVMGYPKSWTWTSYQIIACPELSDHCFIVADLSITIE